MDDSSLDFDIPGRELAVAAEALYLANLMIVPGLGFVALLVLWLRERHRAPELARGHLRQTLAASLWAGALLIVANAAIILAGGYDAFNAEPTNETGTVAKAPVQAPVAATTTLVAAR